MSCTVMYGTSVGDRIEAQRQGVGVVSLIAWSPGYVSGIGLVCQAIKRELHLYKFLVNMVSMVSSTLVTADW